jgi:hypothetical protein
LKKSKHFVWTLEAQEALESLKKSLKKPPILTALARGEPMLLYITAMTEAVSAALVVERDEPDKALKVQWPVYFISEVLSNPKTCYPQIQKLIYVVLISKRKLRHYFNAHPITVVSKCPPKEVIKTPKAERRIAKWALELMGESITYAPNTAIKSQVLADFVAKWTEAQTLAVPIKHETRATYFGESLTKKGGGGGLIFISPLGVCMEYMIQLHSRHRIMSPSTRPSLMDSRSPSR